MFVFCCSILFYIFTNTLYFILLCCFILILSLDPFRVCPKYLNSLNSLWCHCCEELKLPRGSARMFIAQWTKWWQKGCLRIAAVCCGLPIQETRPSDRRYRRSGRNRHFKGAFRCKFFLDLGYCNTFVCIWQLVSNYGLIRFESFVSRFLTQLCN